MNSVDISYKHIQTFTNYRKSCFKSNICKQYKKRSNNEDCKYCILNHGDSFFLKVKHWEKSKRKSSLIREDFQYSMAEFLNSLLVLHIVLLLEVLFDYFKYSEIGLVVITTKSDT